LELRSDKTQLLQAQNLGDKAEKDRLSMVSQGKILIDSTSKPTTLSSVSQVPTNKTKMTVMKMLKPTPGKIEPTTDIS